MSNKCWTKIQVLSKIQVIRGTTKCPQLEKIHVPKLRDAFEDGTPCSEINCNKRLSKGHGFVRAHVVLPDGTKGVVLTCSLHNNDKRMEKRSLWTMTVKPLTKSRPREMPHVGIGARSETWCGRTRGCGRLCWCCRCRCECDLRKCPIPSNTAYFSAF